MAVQKPEALAWDKPPKPSTAPRALSNMIRHVHLIISDHFPQKKVRKNTLKPIEMNEINPASRQSQILRGFWKDPTWCDTANSNSDFSKLDSEILNILKLHQGTISRPHACDACGTGADSAARISPDHQKPAKRQNGLWNLPKWLISEHWNKLLTLATWDHIFKSIFLVVSNPLWNMSSSVGIIISNMWKNKTCSKPPTSFLILGPSESPKTSELFHRDCQAPNFSRPGPRSFLKENMSQVHRRLLRRSEENWSGAVGNNRS